MTPWLRRSAGVLLILVGIAGAKWLAVRSFGLTELRFDARKIAGVFALRTFCLGAGCWLLLREVPFLRRRSVSLLSLVGLVAVPIGSYFWRFEAAAPRAAERFVGWRVGSVAFPPLEASASDWVEEYSWKLSERGSKWLAAKVHAICGEVLLRLGENVRAIEHLVEARRLVEAGEAPPPQLHAVLRRLAIAYVRKAEQDNCITMHGPDSCIYPLQNGGLWQEQAAAALAAEAIAAALEVEPEDLGMKWLQHIVGMAMSTSSGVATAASIGGNDASSGTPRFSNVATRLGMHARTLAGGAAMDDFDGDGLLDVITSTSRPDDHMRYYRNDGKGGFEDWSARSGIAAVTGGLNMTHADFDGDGRLDLLLLRGGWSRQDGVQRNALLRQTADGRFEDRTELAGLAEVDWPCLAAAWADYDRDGDLDLYIGNEFLRGSEVAPSQLFRNDGTGKFTDVAEAAGVENGRSVRGVNWGDYDNDGHLDLFVSNFLAPNRLYRNLGDGRFEDVAPELGVASLGFRERSFGGWFFDANNDGWLDIFCASYPLSTRIDSVVSQRLGGAASEETCHLYLNDGRGRYHDVSASYGLAQTHLSMGANYGDVDGDGWLDLYLGTGSPSLEALTPNTLYKNQGGQEFVDATGAARIGHLQKGHAIAFGDLDNDGDQDIYAQLGGFYLADGFQDAVFLNEGTANHSITLRFRSTSLNHFAVGARIRLRVNDAGQQREIHRVVGPGGSFGGSSLQLEVGIGAALRVEELQVQWPDGDTVDTWRDLPANQVIELTQGMPEWTLVSLPGVPPAG